MGVSFKTLGANPLELYNVQANKIVSGLSRDLETPFSAKQIGVIQVNVTEIKEGDSITINESK